MNEIQTENRKLIIESIYETDYKTALSIEHNIILGRFCTPNPISLAMVLQAMIKNIDKKIQDKKERKNLYTIFTLNILSKWNLVDKNRKEIMLGQQSNELQQDINKLFKQWKI